MKKHILNMLPAIFLGFAASFMLYIYEPIITYSANINDFWFDLKLMMTNIILYFSILFIIIVTIFTIIYFISYKLKNEKIYKIILIISFILFTYFYIQGVYLAGNLPVLDGTTIEWENYTIDTIISVVIIAILIAAEMILIKKMNIDKTIRINKFLTLAICAMIFVSVISSLVKPDVFKEKIVVTATTRNINVASTDKNFYIMLVDAVDSYEFAQVVEKNDKYSKTFDDFTYYPDTVSGYTYTRDSIPFIFSGIWNKNEMEFSAYSTKAYNESKFIKELEDNKYNINMYENQITWNDRNAANISNIDIYSDKVHEKRFFKELTKYILFKYLPYPLKKYSRIETADFDSAKVEQESEYFVWNNTVAYENIRDNKELKKIDEDYFQFLHIEGGHVPFNNDEDVNEIPAEEGTYEKKLTATLNIINSFIERLKENNVYDNSVIVIMADHGYWNSQNSVRQNPILYIKGINEHHNMETSDMPISYADLCDSFIELLNGKDTSKIFQNIDKNRVRKFIDNPFNAENSMIEHEVKGKAWDSNAEYETGIKFNR